MKLGRKMVLAVVLSNGLLCCAFFALAAWKRSAAIVIPAYALKWETAEALLNLIRWLPAVQFLALALALGSTEGKREDLFRGFILPAAVLSAILAAAALVLAPGYETSRAAVEASSSRFNATLEATRTALDQARPDEARALFAVLDAIDRKDARVVELKDRLLGAEQRAARKAAGEAEGTRISSRNPAEAAKSLASAKDYFRQRDYYSAHWLAERALELDPGLAEAKRLGERAWGEILAQGTGAEDAARASFFARKLEAFGRLRSGDSVGAYARFLEMSKTSPSDPDVRRYLAESLAGIEAEAFFRDEAEVAAEARVFPAFYAILPSKDGRTRALKAREVAFAPSVAYLMDAEYLELDKDGTISLQVATPWAKLLEGRLLLESVERERPDLVHRPVAAGGERAPLHLEIALDPLTAYRLTVGLRIPASASVLDLFQGGRLAPGYGISDLPYFLELLRRLGLPFALFGASILGALIGLGLRKPEGKPRKLAWLSLPIMAGATAITWLALVDVDRSTSLWILHLVPGPASLVLSGGIRFVLLALLVILAAGLRHHAHSESQD